MPDTITAPTETRAPDADERIAPDFPWVVIVWNDPINLMSYVTYVFQKLFNYPRAKAHKHMMEVHEQGRSVVWSGPRERSEAYVSALHGYGLWATMQQDR